MLEQFQMDPYHTHLVVDIIQVATFVVSPHPLLGHMCNEVVNFLLWIWWDHKSCGLVEKDLCYGACHKTFLCIQCPLSSRSLCVLFCVSQVLITAAWVQDLAGKSGGKTDQLCCWTLLLLMLWWCQYDVNGSKKMHIWHMCQDCYCGTDFFFHQTFQLKWLE